MGHALLDRVLADDTVMKTIGNSYCAKFMRRMLKIKIADMRHRVVYVDLLKPLTEKPGTRSESWGDIDADVLEEMMEEGPLADLKAYCVRWIQSDIA